MEACNPLKPLLEHSEPRPAFFPHLTRRELSKGRVALYSPVYLTRFDRRHAMDFLNTWPAMIGMFVAVVGLIGLLIFMRKKNKEE